MKYTIDPILTVRIENNCASYDFLSDSLVFATRPVTRNCKNGYLFYDEKERNLGIVYMSDDKRTAGGGRYGNAELFFYKKFKQEFGTWRIIKEDGEYLPLKRLERYLTEKGQYRCTTDARSRMEHCLDDYNDHIK